MLEVSKLTLKGNVKPIERMKKINEYVQTVTVARLDKLNTRQSFVYIYIPPTISPWVYSTGKTS